MDEAEYWDRLEYRVCRELSGLRDAQLRSLWCDGFIPESIDSDAGIARVTGCAWIGIGGRHQESWQFTLLVGGIQQRRGLIDWAALLPEENVTGWLSLDRTRKSLRIDPANAYPDPAQTRS